MREEIDLFLSQRSLAVHSQKAYAYDLEQFLQVVGEEISSQSLRQYEQSLLVLKASAKNRKLSVVNQFLYYLYDKGKLAHFYRLTSQERLPKREIVGQPLDLSALYQPDENEQGQLLALLMLELGLTPSQVLTLEWAWFDLDLRIVRLQSKQQVRILSLTPALIPLLSTHQGQTYLFEHEGQAYSRQWLHRILANYLKDKGLGHLTAKNLREEYIKKQVAAGLDATSLAKRLGIKSPLTLERYYN